MLLHAKHLKLIKFDENKTNYQDRFMPFQNLNITLKNVLAQRPGFCHTSRHVIKRYIIGVAE